MFDMSFENNETDVHHENESRVFSFRALQFESVQDNAEKSNDRYVFNDNVEEMCMFCSEHFCSKKDLENHINMVIECEYCKTWFCSRAVFSEHVKNHENIALEKAGADSDSREVSYEFINIAAQSKHQFSLDKERFSSEIVTTEYKQVYTGGNLLSCDICKKLFTQRTHCDCATHEHDSFQCDYCQRLYRNKNRLTAHIFAHMYGKQFQCNQCKKKYLYKKSLIDHTRLHTGEGTVECKICGKELNSDRILGLHLQVHMSERKFGCEICDKKFLSKPALKQHTLKHNPEFKRCDICGNNYTPGYFPIHQRKHTGERPFECEHCSKTFAQQSGLWEHKVVHDTEKKYHCTCGKQFSRSKELKRHAMQHTGRGYCYCRHCHRAFSSKWLLDNHERKHTGERPFACNFCGANFTQKANLTTHERRHTGEKPFACEYCGRRFGFKAKLKQHVMIHTGEKPYSCRFCNTFFRQLSTLQTHKRTHTQENPFKCGSCGQKFARKLLLTRHMSRIHVPMFV